MNIFDTPEFVAAHQARGGSPFRSLDRSQQADLLTTLHLGISSVSTHPGFNENEARTDAEVKHLNDILIEMVNVIIRSLSSCLPSFSKLFWFSRSLLGFPVPFSFDTRIGIPLSAISLANIIFPAPILKLVNYLGIPFLLYSALSISRKNSVVSCTSVAPI